VKVGVVGHVEWIEFVAVERVPAPGDIVVAEEWWGEAAGGGAGAAVDLARLAGSSALFTALGDDELGRRSAGELQSHGVHVETAWREHEPQRRGFCYLDADGERTITILGDKLRPQRAEPLHWESLAEFDGVYFTGGDVDALRAARAARVLVATARELPTLARAGVDLDALVASASDPAERYSDGDLDPPPRVVARTEGRKGGALEPGGRWAPAPLRGPKADAYGAGDCFAAGLTFGLAQGLDPHEAAELGARRAAEAMTRRGAYGGGPRA
jgi:ribokinase